MEQVIAFLERLFKSFDSQESLAFAAFVLGAFLLGLIFAWLVHGTRARRRRKANAKLRQQVLDLEAQQHKVKEELELKDADLEKLRLELEQQRIANTELRTQLEATQQQLHQRTEENAKLQAAAHSYTGTIDELNKQVVGLTSRLEAGEALGATVSAEDGEAALFRLQQLELRMNQLEQTNQDLRLQVENMRDHAQMLEATGGDTPLDLTANNSPAAAQLLSIEADMTDIDEREVPLDLPPVDSLEVAEAPSTAAAPVAAAAPLINEAKAAVPMDGEAFPNDDLTRIKGIGPFIEQQLNDIGITSYRQVAAMDDRNVQEVTKAIGFFEGRIKEDRWVAQAQALLEADETTPTAQLDMDDLKIVEGIGPKIESVLKTGGIQTLPELADASAELLKNLLKEAGKRYQMHDPGTWSQQAQLAVDGKLDELSEFKRFLGSSKVK